MVRLSVIALNTSHNTKLTTSYADTFIVKMQKHFLHPNVGSVTPNPIGSVQRQKSKTSFHKFRSVEFRV